MYSEWVDQAELANKGSNGSSSSSSSIKKTSIRDDDEEDDYDGAQSEAEEGHDEED